MPIAQMLLPELEQEVEATRRHERRGVREEPDLPAAHGRPRAADLRADGRRA